VNLANLQTDRRIKNVEVICRNENSLGMSFIASSQNIGVSAHEKAGELVLQTGSLSVGFAPQVADVDKIPWIIAFIKVSQKIGRTDLGYVSKLIIGEEVRHNKDPIIKENYPQFKTLRFYSK
jgi:hypothetical protein